MTDAQGQRDEIAISSAKASAFNCATTWLQRLIDLGASSEEVEATIKQIAQYAIIYRSRKDGEKMVAELRP